MRQLLFLSWARICLSFLERFEGCLNSIQRSPFSALRSAPDTWRHSSLRSSSMPLRDVNYLGGRLLGHELGEDQDVVFQAIGDPGIRIRPRDNLLNPSMGGAHDLLGAVVEEDRPSAGNHIAPGPGLRHDPDNASPTVALGAQAQLTQHNLLGPLCSSQSDLGSSRPGA